MIPVVSGTLLQADQEESLAEVVPAKEYGYSFWFKYALSHHFIMGKMTHLQILLL